MYKIYVPDKPGNMLLLWKAILLAIFIIFKILFIFILTVPFYYINKIMSTENIQMPAFKAKQGFTRRIWKEHQLQSCCGNQTFSKAAKVSKKTKF